MLEAGWCKKDVPHRHRPPCPQSGENRSIHDTQGLPGFGRERVCFVG